MRIMLAAAAAVLLGLVVTPGATAAGRTYWAQGGYAPSHAYRPYLLAVSGDGSLFVRPTRWTRWTATRAHGHGTANIDTCNPTCAQGKLLHHRVRVSLSRPRHVCGREFFTHLVLTYPRPDGTVKRYSSRATIVC